MVKIKQLYTQYNINTEKTPLPILDIEIENETIDHFQKGYTEKNITYFTGVYEPSWIEDQVELEITITVNLKKYTQKEIQISTDFINNIKNDELTDELFRKFLSEKVVTITRKIKNNFTDTTTYSIFGNIIDES